MERAIVKQLLLEAAETNDPFRRATIHALLLRDIPHTSTEDRSHQLQGLFLAWINGGFALSSLLTEVTNHIIQLHQGENGHFDRLLSFLLQRELELHTLLAEAEVSISDGHDRDPDGYSLAKRLVEYSIRLSEICEVKRHMKELGVHDNL